MLVNSEYFNNFVNKEDKNGIVSKEFLQMFEKSS